MTSFDISNSNGDYVLTFSEIDDGVYQVSFNEHDGIGDIGFVKDVINVLQAFVNGIEDGVSLTETPLQ